MTGERIQNKALFRLLLFFLNLIDRGSLREESPARFRNPPFFPARLSAPIRCLPPLPERACGRKNPFQRPGRRGHLLFLRGRAAGSDPHLLGNDQNPSPRPDSSSGKSGTHLLFAAIPEGERSRVVPFSRPVPRQRPEIQKISRPAFPFRSPRLICLRKEADESAILPTSDPGTTFEVFGDENLRYNLTFFRRAEFFLRIRGKHFSSIEANE